jgi:hypothetical protein
MQKNEIVNGFPWLQSKPERSIFKELGFACVYAVGPIGGRPLKISWSRQFKEKLLELQGGNWKELQVHDVVWMNGDILAMRLLSEVVSFFDKAKRRLLGDWYDVTPELASQALRLATDKTGVPTFTHAEMLDRVRTERKRRIEAAIRRA